MPAGSRSVYVDTADPILGIACPRCGLLTARFGQYCRNCNYQLWPTTDIAARAFRAWQEADPVVRRRASVFSTELPEDAGPPVVDYAARAHELGIHIFPNSNNPFVICVGVLFVFLALPPFPVPVRITTLVLGLLILLWGVVGWVIREDVQMYEESAEGTHT